MKTIKQNWFETLNEALESENLIDYWDITRSGISYGENARFTVQISDKKYLHISIFRETNGLYERPIHYFC